MLFINKHSFSNIIYKIFYKKRTKGERSLVPTAAGEHIIRIPRQSRQEGLGSINPLVLTHLDPHARKWLTAAARRGTLDQGRSLARSVCSFPYKARFYMFITEEQAQQRLNSPKNLANRFKNGRQINANEIPETSQESCEDVHQESVQFREIKRRGNNRPWLSKEERTRIYAEATPAPFNEHKVGQKEIARRFGVAVSTVSDIVNNKRRVESPRSVDANLVQSAQAKVDEALDKVREQAIDRLMAGLGQLTDDKISAHNAKDISTVCSNMARVVQQTIPQEKGAQAINLIVYTPELRNESNFDIIEVGE